MIYHAARLIILTSFIGYTRDNLSAAAPLLKDIDHKIEKVDNFLGYWKLKLKIKHTPHTNLNKAIYSFPECKFETPKQTIEIFGCESKCKNSENYRSDVIHKITHSHPTPFQSYTLPILHSSNPTPFQYYTLPILHSSYLTLFQS